MKKKKGFSIIELIVVVSILNILATIAIAGYQDYTKKARIAEAPLMLKSLVIRIEEYMKDAPPKSQGKCELVDSNGRCQDNFPKNAEDTGFSTNRGTVFGNFFEFKVKAPVPTDCGMKFYNRYAYALPFVKSEIAEGYQYMCMNQRFDLFHSSKSSDPGNPGGNPGGGNPDPGKPEKEKKK